ncbi:hypothetical protein POM88_023438 [Heracleum sosnowskyi]|uniref:Complement Clr-like EGF domain-containing protein n=1 Tax=Heracleum sosnowskyi TaxID=360622 RepID=A0AAD8IIA3_9APIA|nr:hypothetical protein POM88_023438 [Heracleum sosnowskyi]
MIFECCGTLVHLISPFAASGPGRCKVNNGGCWHDTRDGHTFSACSDKGDGKCACPAGFKGDIVKSCVDVDECKDKKACQCPEYSCKNTWGSMIPAYKYDLIKKI